MQQQLIGCTESRQKEFDLKFVELPIWGTGSQSKLIEEVEVFSYQKYQILMKDECLTSCKKINFFNLFFAKIFYFYFCPFTYAYTVKPIKQKYLLEL